MGLFDSMLGNLGTGLNATALGEKVGLPADKVEQVVAALGVAHSQPGDTVASAAESTGLSQDQVGQIVSQLGGEGGLAKLSGLLGKDGQNNPLGDTLTGFFGR